MNLAMLAVLLASVKPLQFPAQPIPAELGRGERVYYQHRGLERVLAEDRVVIGTWFDGRIKRDVEDAIWLSPSLASRWLGYLNAKEKWSLAELQGRWQCILRALDGRMTFIVQLSALPRKDLLELGAEAPARPSDLRDSRFLVTYRQSVLDPPTEGHVEQGKGALARIEPQVSVLGEFRAYDWRPLFDTKWYQLDPALRPFLPEFERSAVADPYRNLLGDHRSAIFLAQSPLPAESVRPEQVELRVFKPGREVVARFSLYNPPFLQ